jgi:hypothetical protein
MAVPMSIAEMFRLGFAGNKPDWKLLARASSQFHNTVMAAARIIVQEAHLPVDKKTIKPVNMGGIAGGTKFVVNGVFIKLTEDPDIGGGKRLYGKDCEDYDAAAKVFLSLPAACALVASYAVCLVAFFFSKFLSLRLDCIRVCCPDADQSPMSLGASLLPWHVLTLCTGDESCSA